MKLRILQFIFLFFTGFALQAQVTTSSMSGKITDNSGIELIGATIIATHAPSGTQYGTVTNDKGYYSISNMRIGGPYVVEVSYVGYETKITDNIFLSLGVNKNLNVTLAEQGVELSEIVISGKLDPVFSSNRTGAATAVNREALSSMPTLTRRINDFTRLTPQASGTSFAGQDNRLNNITVDGSYFNNSFGLAGQPGDRTGVSPISLDAIEEIQVNLAPYDVRQGNFVGAAVNTVTRSGTNELKGSVYHFLRHENIVGRKINNLNFDPGKFNYGQTGAWLSGAIVKNKLFFFASFETEKLTEPGTTFRANRGTEAVGGNVTRVLESDLNTLSDYLAKNFNYFTGPYQGYDNSTNANKYLFKLDYNLNRNNKISLRYNHLDSDTDVLLSNSSSLGFGSRRSNLTGLNFRNSNYKIKENIRSIVGEWNSTIGNNMSNNLIIGYTFQDESRDSLGSFFPMVDILKEGSVYTTFGFEPFTPNNELRYKSWQLQNNFNIYSGKHTYTFGLSFERYESENVFFPGSQSVYVYNSLEDFYTDANDYLANPNRATSPVNLRRFQVRWSNIPGQSKPVQPLEVNYAGIYAQDKWVVNDKFNLTYGLRVEVPVFGNTAFRNPQVEELNFKDENGNTVKYATDKLPDANLLWSPRLGFNYAFDEERNTQMRGGSGIFSGRPAYVWISNQIGNNGLLTGFERLDNTTQRPFDPNPDRYKPTNVTGDPASQYELALTDPGFQFPQIWRTNLAVDRKLIWGLIGTLEAIYNRDINGIYYINANLADPNSALSGPDTRPRWTSTANSRINQNIDNAIVLKNQNVGYSWNFAATIEKPFVDDLFFKLGYSYGIAKNTVDPGSIAFGSWNNNQHSGNPNNPGLGFSSNTLGHRVFSALTYRVRYSEDKGFTTFSLFYDGANQGVASYVYAGDLNGDGGTSNDLLYIPRNKDEMNFEQYSANNVTFTVDMQKEAFEKFINQDAYLSKNRGKYAERGGILLPMVHRLDLSIAHDFTIKVGGKRNGLQFRLDVINFTNMLNPNWGGGQRLTANAPLIFRSVNAQGQPVFRMQQFGGELISQSFQPTANVSDVYRIQFGVRYTFN